MQENSMLNNPNYDPNGFIGWLIQDVFKVRNDAELSRKLEVAPPVISKIRMKRMPVGPTFLIRVHDLTGMPINDLRRQMGIEQV